MIKQITIYLTYSNNYSGQFTKCTFDIIKIMFISLYFLLIMCYIPVAAGYGKRVAVLDYVEPSPRGMLQRKAQNNCVSFYLTKIIFWFMMENLLEGFTLCN